MRELTKAELELVTGGSNTVQLDTVYAMAGDWSYGSFDWSSDDWSFVPSYEYVYDNSGAGEPAPNTCELNDDASVDAYTDALASKITRDIRAMSDYQSREYIAIIYRDPSGSIRQSDLVAGGPGSATIQLDALGIAPQAILGVVHNHPSGIYGGGLTSFNINRFPSEGDWATADSLVEAGANPSQLTLFLLGTDSVLREYNYANKSTYQNPTSTSNPGPTLSQTLVPDYCP